MKTLLVLLLIATQVHAQSSGKVPVSDVLKLSMAKIRVTKGLEKNWKKCFGTEAPDLENFLEIPTTIMAVNAVKQLNKKIPDTYSCQDALVPEYKFSDQSLCLIDEKVAEDIYAFTQDEVAFDYLVLLQEKTDAKSIDKAITTENAQAMIEFFRKLNQKKMDGIKKKKK